MVVVDGGSTDGSLQMLLYYRQWLDISIIHNTTRNIGYIRNVGCHVADGEILLNTSSDIYFPPDTLERLDRHFREHPELVAVGCKTLPTGSYTPLIAKLSYGAFDTLRFLLTCRVMPIKKLRPPGNFLAIHRDVFHAVGGYPEVPINEDGLLGQKLDEYWLRHSHKTCEFSTKFTVWHHVKRFEKEGGVKGILFYIYVIGLVFPFLAPLFRPIERISGQKFAER